MPFPMGWRLPNNQFLKYSGYFMQFPAKCLVNWAQTPCGGWRIDNMNFV